MARRRGAFWARRRSPAPHPTGQALERRLGRPPDPVSGSGRKLAQTFWGQAWCANLERYRDFENRLPRGRTYLRRGSVLDLHVSAGTINAVVLGSSLYDVRIDIDRIAPAPLRALREQCRSRLSSVVALLEGRLGDDVMAAVTTPRTGLFPEPRQIRLSCSCPDWATMCKHVAAVLYGVGVRLDRDPALVFTLRGIEPDALVGTGTSMTSDTARPGSSSKLAPAELSAIFGVTIDDALPATAATPAPKARRREAAGRSSTRSETVHSAPPRPAHARSPSASWDPAEIATWTIGELAARTGRSPAEIVAFALGPGGLRRSDGAPGPSRRDLRRP